MEDNKEIEAVAIHVDVDDDKGLNESAGEPSCQEEKEEQQQQQQQHQQGAKGPITIITRVPEQRLCKVEEVQGLVETIRYELGKSLTQISSKKDRPTIVIPRVPEQLRKGEEEAYEPYVVSIGPYHMGKPRLEPMQLHKWRFLQQILDRNPNVALNDYILAITSLEERARSCYPENIGLSKNDFVKMLLLDGCFLVEYSLLTTDQLFDVVWYGCHFLTDFLLLENQIPFFILQCIYELATPTTDSEDPTSFTRIAIDICNVMSQAKKNMPPPPPAAEIHHLLHLYHMYTLWSPVSDSGSSSQPTVTFIGELKSKFWSLLSSFDINRCLKKSSSTSELEEIVNMIPSAVKLNEAGIKLKTKWFAHGSFLDVAFSSDGVIEIPRLIIDYLTNSVFRNLIAFEQLYPRSELKFTEYVNFLNYIVNTPKDAALLFRYGIIEPNWANEEEIVRLFNRLARGTSARPTNYLHGIYQEVDKYCKARRHRWRATLIRDYLGSPWSVFSLAVAFILLLLTFLQTYYSMYSYYHPSP